MEIFYRDCENRYLEHFDASIDEKILDWLKQNSLFKVEVTQQSGFSNPAYVFFGRNGTLCALYPKIEDIQLSDFMKTR